LELITALNNITLSLFLTDEYVESGRYTSQKTETSFENSETQEITQNILRFKITGISAQEAWR